MRIRYSYLLCSFMSVYLYAGGLPIGFNKRPKGLIGRVTQPVQNKLTFADTQLNDEQFMDRLHQVFKTELDWLNKGHILVSAESAKLNPGGTVSDVEYKRTLMCLMTLKWAVNDEYDMFTKGQPDVVKMTKEQFDEMRHATLKALPNDEALFAMFVWLLTNDFGKIKEFEEAVNSDRQIKLHDHDEILAVGYKFYNNYMTFIPSFSLVDQKYRAIITKGQGADFSFGQFLQAENLPGNLLKVVKLNKTTLEFFIIHSIYDIAGAAGNLQTLPFTKGSLAMNGAAYTSVALASDALYKKLGAQETYEEYLKNQAQRFKFDYQPTRRRSGLNPELSYNRALLRLALMTRAASMKDIEFVKKAFDDLPEGARTVLITELNKNGINNHGILLYYGPALLLNSKKNYGEAGLKNALELMELIFAHTRLLKIGFNKPRGITTVNVGFIASDIAAKKLDIANLNMLILAIPLVLEEKSDNEADATIDLALLEKAQSKFTKPAPVKAPRMSIK